MARASWVQTNFNGGEWSPLAYGRVDIQKYANGLSLCSRFIPTQQGGLARCPGTRFVAEAKEHTYAPRLRRFEFSTTQAYMLEFGHNYVRFFLNEGQLLSSGSPYEVVTTYTSAQIWDMDFAQNADTLYIAHGSHPLRKLQRLGATSWSLSQVSLLDGPYLPINVTATTLTPSAVTGVATVAASSTVGINNGAGFRAADVGRMLRIKCGSNWLWGTITAFTDTTHVSWTVVPANGISYTAGATADWRLGLYNSTDGYPNSVTFHQGRLILGGSAAYPSRLDGSNTGDPENFAPTNPSGTQVDSNAFSATLEAGNVNAIQWLASDEWGLLAGTVGNEWAIAPSNTQQAITATNANQKPLSPYGSARVAPVKVGKATLYVQRTKRKLRELFYHFTYDTFQAIDLSLLGEHLTRSGLKQLCAQLAPQQLVWAVRNDNQLVALTYDKDQEVVGWHQHPIGGYSNAGRTVGALVESADCIPSPDITRDTPWLVVNRYINGQTRRYIEYFAKPWEDGDAIEDAVFLDSSAEYRGAPATTISGLTWLVGETVGVLADGAVHPDRVVSAGGTITLQAPASVVQVGLRYKSAARTLYPEAGGVKGPAQGKIKRVIGVVLRMFQTLGLQIGSDAEAVDAYPVAFRTTDDPMGSAPALFSGDMPLGYEGTWDMESRVYFETTDPTPCTITLLVANLDTKDE